MGAKTFITVAALHNGPGIEFPGMHGVERYGLPSCIADFAGSVHGHIICGKPVG